MLYQYSKMEEVYEDRRGANEDVWEETGIDFSKIAWEESVLQSKSALAYNEFDPVEVAYLCNKFALLELPAGKRNITILIQFRAPYLGLCCSLC
jgi:hypothetical protein